MTDVIIKKVNSVNVQVLSDSSIAQEISDAFTFMAPGAKFHPSVRAKFWDGKIRMFNVNTRLIYAGLTEQISSFCEARDYTVEIDPDLQIKYSVDDEYLDDLIKEIKPKFEPRDYQRSAFLHAVNNSRAVMLSPTASGKSLIIYLLCRHYNMENKKVLIVVPTTSLVYQMRSDFIDYNHGRDLSVSIIMAGMDKNQNTDITVSTWQSLKDMPKSWFSQFDVVIGDEAHQFKAKSLTDIMTKLTECEHRIGFTGTLDGQFTNEMTLTGLFGPVFRVTSTKELMDDNTLALLTIKALKLEYTDEEKKLLAKAKYQEEMDWIVNHPRRNRFIKNLCLNIEGNTLVLFQYVDKHGKVLYNDISSSVAESRKVFFIHGGVETEDREETRSIVENEKDAIIIASYGTYSTGINIKNLHNVVFASPTKSKIRALQSIGRGLRTADAKTTATLYDIFDDLRWKSHVNYTMNHFIERAKIYDEENFTYKIYNIKV
jgi:superfamily II DNA or RNA helicase